ncbi:type IV secretion system DNA-binding domain-containing protein [Clavibacter tessellarius]
MPYSEEVVSGTALRDCAGHIGPRPAEAGVHGVAGTSVGFDDAMLGRHVLYLGGIGTGKTVGISALVASVRASMTADDVMVVFDTKGDYHEMFHRPGDAVIAAALADEFAGQVAWNLFEEFRALPPGRLPEDEIFEMCSGLFSRLIADAGDNAYFANAARDVFTALVTAMYRESEERSNRDIRMIVGSMGIGEMHALLDRPENADLRGARHYIAKEGSNSTMATMAFMQQVIQESFRSSFGRPGDFSIRAFLRAKGARALFLEYDIASGSTLAPVFTAMLDVAMKEAMSRRRAAGRVFFVLDEFALLPEAHAPLRRRELRPLARAAVRRGDAERQAGAGDVRARDGRVGAVGVRIRVRVPPLRRGLPALRRRPVRREPQADAVRLLRARLRPPRGGHHGRGGRGLGPLEPRRRDLHRVAARRPPGAVHVRGAGGVAVAVGP